MRRWIALSWQASSLAVAGVLYYLFVLPRWHELNGEWSHTLGTVMRIAAGVIVGLAALPVVFTLIKSRKPEYGTPALALSLRLWSIVLHVLAGVLIVGTAIAEIWLTLDKAGQWMFGIYGAAAAIALLGALTFYLAYLAELPPPPPKPLKPKERSRIRGRRKGATDDALEDDALEDTDGTDEPVVASTDEDDKTDEADEADEDADEPVVVSNDEADVPDEADAADGPEPENAEKPQGKLRNRRPSGKPTPRLRRGSRGSVAIED